MHGPAAIADCLEEADVGVAGLGAAEAVVALLQAPQGAHPSLGQRVAAHAGDAQESDHVLEAVAQEVDDLAEDRELLFVGEDAQTPESLARAELALGIGEDAAYAAEEGAHGPEPGILDDEVGKGRALVVGDVIVGGKQEATLLP